jgi:tetratricopeptide (TPR) repeat protein
MKTPEQIKQEAEAAFERGKNYHEKKEYDMAIKEYSEAIMLDSNFVLAYANRGRIYSNRNELDLAIRDYTKAIKLKSTEASVYLERGRIYTVIREYDLAIKDYNETIRLDPTNARAYFFRGHTYRRKKEYDLAIKDYTNGIKLEPNGFGYCIRGSCYAERKDFDLAIKDYNEGLRLDPTDFRGYYYRGAIYFKKGMYDLAIKDYTDANRLNPDMDRPYINEEKCLFCRLPHQLTNGSLAFGNDKFICVKCINKIEIMEKIKLDNEAFYHQIIENYQKYSAFNNEIDSTYGSTEDRAEWLTDLTIDELRIRTREYERPKPPESILINNIPIHKNQSMELLEGEIFKKHPEKDIEVSNLGRVKQGDCIHEQYDPKNNGYLFVDIKSKGEIISDKVYRLVAETWLDKPDLNDHPLKDSKSYCYNTVHHISNNGYDNRLENLMWVTEWQHAMIHPWISIDSFDSGELYNLFYSYADINITSVDYQRIINIIKRIQQLNNDKIKSSEKYDYMGMQTNDWCNNIIEAMEDLIWKNSSNSIAI